MRNQVHGENFDVDFAYPIAVLHSYVVEEDLYLADKWVYEYIGYLGGSGILPDLPRLDSSVRENPLASRFLDELHSNGIEFNLIDFTDFDFDDTIGSEFNGNLEPTRKVSEMPPEHEIVSD